MTEFTWFLLPEKDAIMSEDSRPKSKIMCEVTVVGSLKQKVDDLIRRIEKLKQQRSTGEGRGGEA
jgi:hypothetical protein